MGANLISVTPYFQENGSQASDERNGIRSSSISAISIPVPELNMMQEVEDSQACGGIVFVIHPQKNLVGELVACGWPWEFQRRCIEYPLRHRRLYGLNSS